MVSTFDSLRVCQHSTSVKGLLNYVTVFLEILQFLDQAPRLRIWLTSSPRTDSIPDQKKILKEERLLRLWVVVAEYGEPMQVCLDTGFHRYKSAAHAETLITRSGVHIHSRLAGYTMGADWR